MPGATKSRRLNGMSTRLLVILLLWSSPGYCQLAVEGNYVVVQGALMGCETWKDRILDVARVGSEGRVDLLDYQGIEVLGKSGQDIETLLLAAIEARTDRRPKTLVVTVLTSEQEYRQLVQLYILSLNYFLDNHCPVGSRRGNDKNRDLDENNEILRRKDVVKDVAWSGSGVTLEIVSLA